MKRLTIHERSTDHVFASTPGLLVTSWGGSITTELVGRLERIIRDLVASSKDGRYSAITVIEGTISMRFEDDARERSAALQKRFADHMRCQAYLVEGVGFLPAAVRTVTAGMHLITKSPYPVKVFSDAMTLASWLAPRGELDADDVTRWVNEARNGSGTRA